MTECSNHHPFLSTLRSNGLSGSNMKWSAMYTNLPVNVTVSLPHPRSGDSQGQETFLAISADKQTCNYDTECSNHHPPYLSTLRSKGLSRSKIKCWAICTNLAVNVMAIYIYIYIYIYVFFNIFYVIVVQPLSFWFWHTFWIGKSYMVV